MKTWMIYFTAGTAAEAGKIGRALVRDRLAACVNILGRIRSIYRWKGRVEDGREVAALAKTSEPRLPAAIAAIRKRHSYEVPCIVAWPLERGHAPFMKWIADETAVRTDSR
ncbi:MAG TPA: divalent-cation tolerance protein CutA [Kiritimatiellia bacterium]|nr:divalent-cation tolerance protein CutA [Kiritimatiellia bacterium]HRZ13119.1 divalent-cation tolerance protein CutA [Kiritimatiellia bacterium]HSA17540.1 divalent-cation tolerance protein CutA [Kiritimatiellia bacterium]